VDTWIEQLDSPANIEAHRARRHLELKEIQTKEFDNILADYYVGGEVPRYSGIYFIPESFRCAGCSSLEEWVYVTVWLEIEARQLKTVLTRDPKTGNPAKEIIQPTSPRARLLTFEHQGCEQFEE
jgi:hypothetical protein